MIDPENLTITNLVVGFVVAGVIWKVIQIGAEIIHGQIAVKMGQGNGNGQHANGKVASLESNHNDLRTEMRDGFSSLGTKMETQHTELHRRISELRDDVHNTRVDIAEKYATKEDVRAAEQRCKRSVS